MFTESESQKLTRALREAASNSDERSALGVCHMLLDKGAKPDYWALCAAVREGHTELCSMLLWRGADVDGRYSWGDVSPIVIAAEHGHQDVVRLLIAHGASPKTPGNFAALEHAIAQGRDDMCSLLLSNGWHPSIRKVLYYGSGRVSTCRLMMRFGSDLPGMFDLMSAVKHGYTDAVAYLLPCLDNEWFTRHAPYSPLDNLLSAAAEVGDVGLCRIMLRHGAKEVDLDALKEVVLSGDVRVMHVLLSGNAVNAVYMHRLLDSLLAAVEHGWASMARMIMEFTSRQGSLYDAYPVLCSALELAGKKKRREAVKRVLLRFVVDYVEEEPYEDDADW
jgi:hypothetical protein